MNAFWHYSLGLLAVGLLAECAAAQTPGSTVPLAPPVNVPFAPAQPLAPINDGPMLIFDGAPTQRSGLSAGVGIYVMQPYFQNNPAYTVFTQDQVTPLPFDPDKPNTQTLGESAQRVNVHSHMAVAPLLWLSYVNEDGLGGRLRWWTFREGTSQTMTLPPFVGDIYIGNTTATPGNPSHPVIAVTGNQATIASAAPLGLQTFGNTVGIQYGAEATALNVTTMLYLQVGDLEVIQNFQVGACEFTVAGGLRLAMLNQTYNAYDFQSGNPLAQRKVESSYNFSGVGPTLDLELRRPIGSSGLGVYSTARGSLVIGSAQQTATFSGAELRNNDPNPQFASQKRTRGIPVGELEAGVEYERSVGGSWVFAQIGLFGQEWFGAGSASRATNATVQTTLRPVLGGAPIDSNLAFLGLSVRLGFDY